MYLDLLKGLVSISPRRGANEQIAAKLIKNYLEKEGIEYKSQLFTTDIPVEVKAELVADGENIPCLASSFVSGQISSKAPIVNFYGAEGLTEAIHFNPISHGICLQAYFDYPSVTINRDDVVKLLLAKEYHGLAEVERRTFDSENIIVGNTSNPEIVIIVHYDSIVGSGAIDNGAAVQTVYDLITEQSFLLSKCMFLFAGSEEESISSKSGCYGFTVFEKEYLPILLKSKEIIVIDGVGVSNTSFTNDHLDWAYCPDNLDKLGSKIFWMLNDQSEVMKYYHSTLDTLDKIDPLMVEKAEKALLERITKQL